MDTLLNRPEGSICFFVLALEVLLFCIKAKEVAYGYAVAAKLDQLGLGVDGIDDSAGIARSLPCANGNEDFYHHDSGNGADK